MSKREKLLSMIRRPQPGPRSLSPDSAQRQREYRKKIIEAQKRYRE